MNRGRTIASVRVQYAETVRPLYTRYVEPTRDYADLVVGGHDPTEQSAAAILSHIASNPA